MLETRRGRPIPAIRKIGAPPYRLLDATAFEVARDEGVSLHMPLDRWRLYTATYNVTTGLYRGGSEPERARWDTLRLLESASGPMDPGLVSTLLVSVTEAKAYSRRQQVLARQGGDAIGSLGVPIDWTFDADAGDPRNLAEQRAKAARSALCQPLTADAARPS